jgi:hypothetical protein
MLGVRPRWGRLLSADDTQQADVHTVLIAEAIAHQLFGDPARAVGQRIETTAEPLLVVGVMPASSGAPSTHAGLSRKTSASRSSPGFATASP